MIVTNISDVMGKMRARSPAVVAELRGAAIRMAPQIKAESVRVMNEQIYAIPEKRGKGGKPLWIRSERLRDEEEAEPEGMDVVMSNKMSYAGARYHLGDPERPTLSASRIARQVRPPQRSIQWQRVATQRKRNYILQMRRRAVLRGLRK